MPRWFNSVSHGKSDKWQHKFSVFADFVPDMVLSLCFFFFPPFKSILMEKEEIRTAAEKLKTFLSSSWSRNRNKTEKEEKAKIQPHFYISHF